jgi:hypothetical protein
MKTLDKYYIEEQKLFHEVRSNKLTCLEAILRCNELWKLIPNNISMNPFELNQLMEHKYSKSPDWNYGLTFKILI